MQLPNEPDDSPTIRARILRLLQQVARGVVHDLLPTPGGDIRKNAVKKPGPTGKHSPARKTPR